MMQPKEKKQVGSKVMLKFTIGSKIDRTIHVCTCVFLFNKLIKGPR